MMLGLLPMIAPVLDFTASVSHGESLPRVRRGPRRRDRHADLGAEPALAMCSGTAAAAGCPG